MTFMEMVVKTLEQAQRPLTAQQIWDKAAEYGFQSQVGSKGKTPVMTITARLYSAIKEPGSEIMQVSKRPAMFALVGSAPRADTEANEFADTGPMWHERDMHALLTVFLAGDPAFMCSTRTIYHENSKKGIKGEREWLHPDMVGVHFPFDEFRPETVDLIRSLNDNVSLLFSFELKTRIGFSNLRESYFQAVSNSSWANEGYLVAGEYGSDPALFQEMQRLTNAFGIGFIELDTSHPEQSRVLITSHRNNILDWDTIDRLVESNLDFKKFIGTVVKDVADKEVRNSQAYDHVMDETELRRYQEEKGFV